MKCPKCSNTLKVVEIPEKQLKFGMLEKIRCPHCEVWLRFNSSLFLLQTIGFLLLLVGSVLGLMQGSMNLTYAKIGFFGGLLAFLSGMFNKPKVME